MSVLTKQEVGTILKEYGFEGYIKHVKHWWSLENEVYEIKTKKRRYILKLLREHDEKYLLWNISITEKLRQGGLPLAQTYKTKKGAYLFTHKKRKMLMQEYIAGKELKKVSTRFIQEFAKNLGKMDKALSRLGTKEKYLWKKRGHQFEPGWYRSTSQIEGFNWDKNEKNVVSELNANVNKNRLKHSIIHGDYQLNNLKVAKNKLQAILDFGDMHEDYIAFEVAIALNHFFFVEERANRKYISLFMKEYTKHIKMNADEKKAVYYFIKQRMLAGIVWCDKQRKQNPEKAHTLTKWLRGMIYHYTEFSKLTVENFLLLIE